MGKRTTEAVPAQCSQPVTKRRQSGKSQQAEPKADPFTGCLNAAIQLELCHYDSKVLEHPLFEGIMHDAPTGYTGVPAYDPDVAGRTLNAGQDYVASCHLLWLNLHFEAQPNVPKYKTRIENVRKHFFSEPSKYPEEITIAHIRGEELPHLRQGQLKAVCPPELRDALRMAVGMAVEENQRPDHLQEWRRILQSIPFRFVVTDPDHTLTIAFRCLVQKREDIAVKNDNMRMSSLLRSYEVMDLKAQLEAGGPRQNKKTLAEHYSTLKMAASSDLVSATFVEQTMALHNQVLIVKEVSEICFQFDHLGAKNPMDSVAKYKEVANGCDKKKDLMVWAYQMLWDHWHCTDGKEPIPLRSLEGRVQGWCGKSLTDLFLFKRALRDTLWRRLDQFNWEPEVKNQFKMWTESVVKCRGRFGVIMEPAKPLDGVSADRCLPSSWPPSAEKLLLCMETFVYGYQLDGVIVKTMAHKKSSEDVLEHTDVASLMSAVMTAYEAEQKAAGSIALEDEDPAEAPDEADVEAQNLKIAVTANLSPVEALIGDAEDGVVTLDERVIDTAKSHARLAERRLRSVVKLVPATNQEELAAAIKQSTAGETYGKGKCFVAIVIDAKTLCESGSQAKYRLPPSRPQHLMRLLGAVIVARAEQSHDKLCLPSNDIIVAPDATKGQDWEDKLLRALNPLKLEVTRRYVIYTQESLEKRMDRLHPGTTLEQMEVIPLLSSVAPNFKSMPCKFAPKTNTRGNVIGPLDKTDLADKEATWTMAWADKKELYGSDNLPLPGGHCPVEHKKAKITKGSDLLPVFYHEGPPALATELAHLLQAAAIIDLTPGSGHWAMYAVRRQIPYLGCCLTQTHVNLLYAKLRSRILTSALDANDTDLYDAQLSTLVTSEATGQMGNKDEGNMEGATPSGKPGSAPPDGTREALLDRIASIRATANSSGAGEDIGDD